VVSALAADRTGSWFREQRAHRLAGVDTLIASAGAGAMLTTVSLGIRTSSKDRHRVGAHHLDDVGVILEASEDGRFR
jgi:hypothetical protein